MMSSSGLAPLSRAYSASWIKVEIQAEGTGQEVSG